MKRPLVHHGARCGRLQRNPFIARHLRVAEPGHFAAYFGGAHRNSVGSSCASAAHRCPQLMRLLTNSGRESWKPKLRTRSREDLLSTLPSQDPAAEGVTKFARRYSGGRYFISRSSRCKTGIACDRFWGVKKKILTAYSPPHEDSSAMTRRMRGPATTRSTG